MQYKYISPINVHNKAILVSKMCTKSTVAFWGNKYKGQEISEGNFDVFNCFQNSFDSTHFRPDFRAECRGKNYWVFEELRAPKFP